MNDKHEMQQPPKDEPHEGEAYLQMLGLAEYADTDITTPDGIIKGRDFLAVCGDHARPLFVGLEAMREAMGEDKYNEVISKLREQVVTQYFNIDETY